MFGKEFREPFSKPKVKIGIEKGKNIRSASQDSTFSFPTESFRKKCSISQIYRTELKQKYLKNTYDEISARNEQDNFVLKKKKETDIRTEGRKRNANYNDFSSLSKSILNFSNGLVKKEMPRDNEKKYFKKFLKSNIDLRKLKYTENDKKENIELLRKRCIDFIDGKRNWENTGWMMNAIDLHEEIRSKTDRNDVRKPELMKFYKQYYRQRGNQNVSFKLIFN